MARVAVFGAGHVGLVTGACLAELGHEVTIKDVVEEKVDRLRRGDIPLHEAGLVALLGRNRDRLCFTTDGEEVRASADVLLVCVDTPPTASGDADLTRVWAVVDDVGSSDRPAVLVMKEHGPRGNRAADQKRARRPRPGPGRLRLEPRVHGGGDGRARFPPTGQHRRRLLRRPRRRPRRGAPRRDRRAGCEDRRQLGGDGEARRERSS